MPPTTIDPEIRELMTAVKTQLAEANKTKAAVVQLEEAVKNVPQTIESKLGAMRRALYDPRGTYRGICFDTEEQARGFGLYVLAATGGSQRALGALKSEFKDVFQRAFGDSPDALNTVPVEYASRVQRLVEEYGVFARNAFPMPMNSDTLTFQRRSGGLTVYKTGHNTAATASDLSFVTVNLNAYEWNCVTLYPRALGEDSAIEVGEMVALEIAQAFAEAIDTYGLTGDGTPDDLDVLGITTRLTSINGVDDGGGLVLGAGNAWSELTIDNFLKVKGQARYVREGKWYCSSEFYWTCIAGLIMDAGGRTMMETANGPVLAFLGSPVEITPAMPRAEANSQVCALYGDMRLSSTHGRRKELMIEEDRSVKFIERQVAVLGTQRHAINNHTLGDATTAGPMVGLITASS